MIDKDLVPFLQCADLSPTILCSTTVSRTHLCAIIIDPYPFPETAFSITSLFPVLIDLFELVLLFSHAILFDKKRGENILYLIEKAKPTMEDQLHLYNLL